MPQDKKNRHTLFEWVQLIATICIPVVLGVFAVLQNNAQTEQQNNNAKMATLQRLADIEMADRNREKDQWIADDQQKENVLIDYQNFLGNLLEKSGMTLNETTTARFIARFRTLTALRQLNPLRRSFLIQALYEANLITFGNSENNNTMIKDERSETLQSIIDLTSANLSGLSLGVSEEDNDKCYKECLSGVKVNGLVLSRTQLVRAFFRKLHFQGGLFVEAIMDDADFRCTLLNGTKNDFTFSHASLVRANFRQTCAVEASFRSVNLEKAQMYQMACKDCVFYGANMNHAYLNEVYFYRTHDKDDTLYNDYDDIKFTKASLVSARFEHISLRESIFKDANLSYIHINNCTFSLGTARSAAAILENSTLIDATITYSSFYYVDFSGSNLTRANIVGSNFTYASMKNVDFTNAILEMCYFNDANLSGCIMINTNLYSSYFINTDLTGCQGITDQQLAQARSIAGAILPNGTKVQSK